MSQNHQRIDTLALKHCRSEAVSVHWPVGPSMGPSVLQLVLQSVRPSVHRSVHIGLGFLAIFSMKQLEIFRESILLNERTSDPRQCLSVGPSVCPLIRLSIGPSVHQSLWQSFHIGLGSWPILVENTSKSLHENTSDQSINCDFLNNLYLNRLYHLLPDFGCIVVPLSGLSDVPKKRSASHNYVPLVKKRALNLDSAHH